VIASGIDQRELKSAVAALVAQDLKVEAVVQDVVDAAVWKSTLDQIVERHGSLDVLVNNAATGDFERN